MGGSRRDGGQSNIHRYVVIASIALLSSFTSGVFAQGTSTPSIKPMESLTDDEKHRLQIYLESFPGMDVGISQSGAIVGTPRPAKPSVPQPVRDNANPYSPKLKEMEQHLPQAELERQLEKDEREIAATEAADDARREAEERAREATEQAEERAREATAQAEQVADDLRNEMVRSAVRTKNSLYLGGLLLLIGSFITYLVKRVNREKSMDKNQKYGVVTMIASFLLVLLVLMISEGWTPQFDYLENLMNMLKIQLIKIEAEYGSGYNYLIDIPSKYVVLILLTTAAYGFTTYLGITPAVRPWKKAIDE